MSLTLKLALDRYLGGLLIFVLNLFARLLGVLLQRDHSLRVAGDILVIKMLGGGSLVMAMPALLGIRRTYPHVKMRLFTTGAVKAFAETLCVFDEILVLDDRSLGGLFVSGFRLMKTCFGADTVIDLEIYSYLSTVLSLLTFARNRIGFFYEETGFHTRLHTHRIFFQIASPLYLHYDRIAEILTAPIGTMAECAAQIRRYLGVTAHTAGAGRIAVGCGCSDLSSSVRKLTAEQWSKHVFAAAADRERDVVFLGSHADAMDAAQVIDAVRRDASWTGTIVNGCGTTALPDSLRILAGCDEYWGIDSSLLHYARLFDLKIKAFFGPADPATRLRPINGAQEEIFYRRTLCSPCIHQVSEAPCHGNNVCMKALFDPVETCCSHLWTPVLLGPEHTV